MKPLLTSLERTFLTHLYHYRCGTYSQLYRYLCQDHSVLNENIGQLLQKGLIMKEEWEEETDEIYFLTVQGVNQLKPFLNLTPTEDGKRTHKTAAELRLHPKAYRHHLATLDFILEAKHYLDTRQCLYHIKLDKFGQAYTPVCPDAVIELGNMDILIEMDMGTERLARLKQKMEYYTRLNKRRLGEVDPRPILVFFIFHRTPSMAQLKTLYQAIDSAFLSASSPFLDVVAGTQQELIQLLHEQVIDEAVGHQAPYRQAWKEAFEVSLQATPYQVSMINPLQTKIHQTYDYIWTKPTETTFQIHRLFIDLTVCRLSRLNAVMYLEQSLGEFHRQKRMSEAGVVYLIVEDQKLKTTQFILNILGFQPSDHIQLITTSDLHHRLNRIKTSSMSQK